MAQKALPSMVALRMSMVDSVIAPLVVSLIPNGIRRVRGRNITLYEAEFMRLRVLGTMRSAGVKAGPGRKQVGMSCEAASTMHANVLVTLREAYSARRNWGAEEPGVVAAVNEEKLVFEARVGVGEGSALWLKDGADTFSRSDNIESCEEIVVCQNNDMLQGGKSPPEAGA